MQPENILFLQQLMDPKNLKGKLRLKKYTPEMIHH